MIPASLPTTTIRTIYDECKDRARVSGKRYAKFLSRAILCAEILNVKSIDRLTEILADLAAPTTDDSDDALNGLVMISQSYMVLLVEGPNTDLENFLEGFQSFCKRWSGLPRTHPLMLRERMLEEQQASAQSVSARDGFGSRSQQQAANARLSLGMLALDDPLGDPASAPADTNHITSNPVVLLFQEDIPHCLAKGFHVAYSTSFPSVAAALNGSSLTPYQTEIVADVLKTAITFTGVMAERESEIPNPLSLSPATSRALFITNAIQSNATASVINGLNTLPSKEYLDIVLGKAGDDGGAGAGPDRDLPGKGGNGGMTMRAGGDGEGDTSNFFYERGTKYAVQCEEMYFLDEFVEEVLQEPLLEYPEDNTYNLRPYWIYDNLKAILNKSLAPQQQQQQQHQQPQGSKTHGSQQSGVVGQT